MLYTFIGKFLPGRTGVSIACIEFKCGSYLSFTSFLHFHIFSL